MSGSDAAESAEHVPSRDAAHVVIIGGGLAGYSAADALRKLGHTGSITVIDPEPALYDRPPLSKRLFDDDFMLSGLEFASEEQLAERSIDTRLGRSAASLDAEKRRVTLDDGSVIEADAVLIATGGRARMLPIPGADLPGVHVLRSFADAQAIRAALPDGARVAVVGAGLIGAELASALHAAGARVTLIDPIEVPLVPAVGALMAAHLHDMHGARGIDTRQGMTAEFRELADGGLEVVLSEGQALAADVVVVGVGITPNTEIAAQAGLDVDRGVLVDASFRASIAGVPIDGVYAAGDVARRRDADGTLHRPEEHWEAAQLDGQAVARAMLGLDLPSKGCAWFWSDRHGVHLEAVGRLSGDGDTVVRDGDGHPTVFLLHEGVLVGAAAIDDTMTVRAARRLIDQRIPVNPDALADPAVPLRSLLRAGAEKRASAQTVRRETTETTDHG